MPNALPASSPEAPTPAEVGYAEERKESLLKLALTSLQLARQNLRDTQLSRDARVIGFYEAIALGLRETKDGLSARSSVDDQLRLFMPAASLASEKIEVAEQENAVAHKIVGLEAVCNCATIYQQKALKSRILDKMLELDKVEQSHLAKAVDLYNEVLAKTALGPEPDKCRLELTAEVGLLVCKFASWCAESSGGVGEAAKAKDAADTADKVRLKLSAAKRLPEASLELEDRGSSSSQIIRQTETFLDQVSKALPNQPFSASQPPPSTSA